MSSEQRWSNNISDAAMEWLASGDRGLSSNQMFETILGFPALDEMYRRDVYGNIPRDPWDFGRCLALHRAVPEIREGLNRMRDVSPVWDNIIEHWDHLATLHNGDDWDAEYALLRALRCDP